MQEAKTIQEYKVYHYTYTIPWWSCVGSIRKEQLRNSCGTYVYTRFASLTSFRGFRRAHYTACPAVQHDFSLSASHSVKTVDRVTITAMTIAVLCIFTCMAGECRRCANCNENNYACINVEAAVEVNSPGGGAAGRRPTQEFREW